MAGTVADVLGLMELLDAELETGSAEVDEALAIRAITQAQHYFEMLCAIMPHVLQSTVTASTVASTETTAWSTGLLRFDKMQLLDSNSRPVRDIESIHEVGGHVPGLPWPLQLSAVGSGVPFAFYGNMTSFYWLPLPAGVVTVRVYGFIEAARFTLRTDSVTYPYRCHLGLAQFACKLLSLGVADSTAELDTLAAQVFGPMLKQLRKFDRSKPRSFHYQRIHST